MRRMENILWVPTGLIDRNFQESWVWWHIPVVPVLERIQKDRKFKANLVYIVSLSLCPRPKKQFPRDRFQIQLHHPQSIPRVAKC
jgi:hypothetical protein